MKPDDFRVLVSAGLSSEQIAIVMEMMERDSRAYAEAEEARKSTQRFRTARYRSNLDVTDHEWQHRRLVVFNRDGLACAYCSQTDGPFEVDHIIPLSRGGSSELHNLCVACASCNASKRDKLLAEWRR